MPFPLDETRNIVAVDEALLALGLGESEHNRVERLINSASQWIERYCRTKFKKRREIVFYSGPNHPLLDLGAPVVAVYSVKVGGTTLAVDDYKVLKARGQLYRDGGWLAFSDLFGGWSAGVDNVEVDADYGWDVIPADVVEACLALIRYRRSSDVSGSDGLASERLGDYSYTKSTQVVEAASGWNVGVPPEITGLLDAYTRWS